MRVSSSAAVRSNAGYEARLDRPPGAGSGTLQCTTLRGRRELGADLSNAVAQRDHDVEPLGDELAEVLGAVRTDVDATLLENADGIGMQWLRMATGAGGFDRPARQVDEQRLGDLGPRAVPGTQEQDSLPAMRTPAPSWGQRLGCQPQCGMQSAPRRS